jgi:hypothetical protein
MRELEVKIANSGSAEVADGSAAREFSVCSGFFRRVVEGRKFFQNASRNYPSAESTFEDL